ncbi:DUF4224 domain-containing protein [Paraburkholderia sp. GAS82]|uniref:DUF4224 domain-containing protein n=1 Tax=Paraburkholderia sp. GAS82 TaxID=3035137 RepID=UPI003D1E597C
MEDTFLSPQELVVLTGRKVKSKQIDALRRMGIAFFVNALGKPVVARAAVESRPEVSAQRSVRASWQPRVLAS